jgi:hypothetical protein
MPRCLSRVLLVCVVLMLSLSSPARAGQNDDAELREMLKQWLANKEVKPPAPECEKNCYVLSSLSLRGAVGDAMSFELQGTLLFSGPAKVPLFGPSNQVRLDELTINGATPIVGFEEDHYYVLTAARSFTVRGKITLANDQMLAVVGPLVSLDAKLTRGRLVEGEHLSGVLATTLHFDPMTPESQSVAESKTPKVFRLSHSVRIGKENRFVFRLVMSQATEIGTVHLPLSYGEKVEEVSGAPGWSSSAKELLLPVTGTAADLTITGAFADSAVKDGLRSFGTDDRSAYEWWLVESDPDYRVEMGGEAKLVENSQSPIPATLPTARTYLVQRGQHLEVDARSLVRGEVLAAVARTERRFVSVTARGEVIGDETIAYDNNGLDHLTFTPSGQPMYLSTDGQPGRILHTQAGSAEMLVPLEVGGHKLRVQTISETHLSPLVGLLSIPTSDYPLTTSVVDVTLGLPADVYPIGLFGGDSARWAVARADWVAVLIGISLAWFGFRARRTRVLGSLVTVGLWFVSREAFVLAAAVLFFAGLAFLASRFLRGNALLGASAVALIVSMFGARWALLGDAADAPKRELFVEAPPLPQPESPRPEGRPGSAMDIKTGATPVSLSMPSSERYVQTSRQLVTSKRPFAPRLFYATPTLFAGLEILWLALLGMLVFAHRVGLKGLLVRVRERLSRRADARDALAETLPRW